MLKRSIFLTLLLLSVGQAEPNDPKAQPRAVISHGRARFTILTPRVVRMEWSADSMFEDRASLTIINRRLPVPTYSASKSDSLLTIRTDALTLTYKQDGSPFSPSNLQVRFHTSTVAGEWNPGVVDSVNLLGTVRTLDGMDGEISSRDSSHVRLEPGLLSRSGWTLIDDTERPLLDNSDWPWVVPRPVGPRRDLYFFVYGHDYSVLLRDFISIAGRIPLPPRFAFGYWYSRWRPSTELELRELVQTFRSLEIPLDVLMIDMDWHLTSLPEFFDGTARKKDQAGQDCGWTGFTWNRNLFPEPDTFLSWTERHGLQVSLNLHPASGVQPHEEQYPAMARALGIDPATRAYVPFNIVDKRFAAAYFDLILHPMEDQGVDFWWLDWQQWNTTAIPGVNPTFYLNYLHFTDMERRGLKRPFIYHRWGGLGNHRYQIGFSGDTKISWPSLAFQPYFTTTASNVGFGYWGNDIGGFYGTPNTPELFARWFQFGVFSPILKTHATGRDYTILRKIWEYPHDTFLHLRDLIRLRYAFIPYLYTAARNAYDTGISPCHPLYYHHPESDEAYAFRNEYYFGPDLIVHPITRPLGTDSLFVPHSTWLPPGTWYEWHSGSLLRGDTVVTRPFRLTDIPLYVRAGAIIPMAPPMQHTGARPLDPLILTVCPGDSGAASLYEDEGNTDGYRTGASSRTRFSSHRNGSFFTITVEPAVGAYPGMPSVRRLEFRFPSTFPPLAVSANGTPVGYREEGGDGTWHYEGPTLTAVVSLPPKGVRKRTIVTLLLPDANPALLDGAKYRMELLNRFTQFLADRRNFRRQDQWSDARHPSDHVMRAAQTGIRIGNRPVEAVNELRALERDWPVLLETIGRVAEDYPQFRGQYHLLRSAPGGTR